MNRHGIAVRCNTPIRTIILISFAAKPAKYHKSRRNNTMIGKVMRDQQRQPEKSVPGTFTEALPAYGKLPGMGDLEHCLTV